MYRCGHCKETKDENAFFPSAIGANKLTCKKCRRIKQTCKHPGCVKKQARGVYCCAHATALARANLGHGIEEIKVQFAIVKRDKHLRDRHLRTLYTNSAGRCADPFGRCLYNKHGETLPMEVADVDHIVALNRGGTNALENLQLLCACCHKLKTRQEYGLILPGLVRNNQPTDQNCL